MTIIVSSYWVLINSQSETESCSVVSNSLQPHGLYNPLILQARLLEWVALSFSRGSSQISDRTQISHIAGRFFISWATGKPKNTGVGSPSLLQQIFPTQELTQGVLHCRQILYQLSYEGSLEPGIIDPRSPPSPSSSPSPHRCLHHHHSIFTSIRKLLIMGHSYIHYLF